MKTLASALLISASLFGAAAHADDDATRIQVKAELAAARAAGQLDYGLDFQPPGISTAPSTVTREQVVAELKEAKANGGIVYDEELPDGPYFADRNSAKQAVAAKQSATRVAQHYTEPLGGYPSKFN